MKITVKILAIIFLMMNVSISLAFWDGSVTGKVGRLEVTNGDNYGLRIYLKENPKLCNNSTTWGYIDPSNSNYDIYVSLITASKFADATVTLHTTQTSSGLCEIVLLYVI